METKHANFVTTYRHEFFGIEYLYGIQGIELDKRQLLSIGQILFQYFVLTQYQDTTDKVKQHYFLNV